jgi:hypothetical protein
MEQLAAKEGKSQFWISKRLLFGRFLNFISVDIKSENTPNNPRRVGALAGCTRGQNHVKSAWCTFDASSAISFLTRSCRLMMWRIVQPS